MPRALAVVLAAAGALLLSACVPGALDGEPTQPTTSGAPAPSTAPPDPDPSAFEPAPSVAPSVAPVAGELDLACDAVLTPDDVYAFNPELLATATPDSGVPADLEPYAEDGVVCAWQHATSRDPLLVGVLRAEDGEPAPFTAMPGRAEVVGDWLVAVASPYFQDADADAQALIEQVADNLD